MKNLIAIVGMSGSGKSIATDYLENLGYTKLYFGGITYQLMEEAGIERTSDGKSEKEFREKLRQDHGPECYAKFLEPDIKEALKVGNVVLDGLYSWYEYKYLDGNNVTDGGTVGATQQETAISFIEGAADKVSTATITIVEGAADAQYVQIKSNDYL